MSFTSWLSLLSLGVIALWELRALRGARREHARLTRELATKEALLQADARMRALVASLDDAIVITDAQGEILDWNRPASELFGFSAEQMLGTSVAKLIGSEGLTLDEIVAPLPHETSSKRVIELLAARSDGSVFQCELSGREVQVGTERLWLLLFRDIAERTRAQLALQRSEDKYRALAVHAPVGILETDAQGACTFVNRRWTEITGITFEEALGAGWAMSIHPEDAQTARLAWREAAQTGTPFAVDSRYISKAGVVAWVHGACLPLRDAYGETTGYLATMIDVTERRRTLEALAKSEASFRALVERAPFGFLVMHRGVVTYANQTYLSMFGFRDPAEITGAVMLDKLVHPASRELVIERARARAAGVQLEPASVRCMRQDGVEIFVEGASTPIDFDGQPCMAFVLRDVTDRERAETIRLATERSTRESLREKEVLLKEVHHRVKNNLQVIVSLINLQAAKLEDPAMRAAFEETRSRVHAIALLHERLYGSKNLGRIDMRDYLSGLASDLSSTNVDTRSIQLRVEAEDLYFEMDAAVPIGLIVNELVTNAYKHAFPRRETGGTIWVKLAREDSEIKIEVSDDGTGYPAGLDPDTVDSLGLLLISSLSRQLEGHASFETLAAGARCTVRFPSRSAHSSLAATEAPSPSPEAGSKVATAPGAQVGDGSVL